MQQRACAQPHTGCVCVHSLQSEDAMSHWARRMAQWGLGACTPQIEWQPQAQVGQCLAHPPQAACTWPPHHLQRNKSATTAPSSSCAAASTPSKTSAL
jgi:hypothetical protein